MCDVKANQKSKRLIKRIQVILLDTTITMSAGNALISAPLILFLWAYNIYRNIIIINCHR